MNKQNILWPKQNSTLGEVFRLDSYNLRYSLRRDHGGFRCKRDFLYVGSVFTGFTGINTVNSVKTEPASMEKQKIYILF